MKGDDNVWRMWYKDEILLDGDRRMAWHESV